MSEANVPKRQVRKVERRLAAARKLEAKRTRQLEKARRRGTVLEATLSALKTGAGPAAGPQAYCMREKRTVTMIEPVAIVMRNGRAAVSGTCPNCGAHVVTTAREALEAAVDGPSQLVET